MKRNPVYSFGNLDASGISKIPLNSMVHITDINNIEPGFQPIVIQLIDKTNVNDSTTIGQFLTMTGNYAIPSDTTEIQSELEKIHEGGNDGWRLLGTDPGFSGDIGQRGVDFSISTKNIGATGATGENSFAIGEENTAEGKNSFAAGKGNTAQENQTVVGEFNNINLNTPAFFIVGAGTVTTAANALEIGKDGSVRAPLAYNAPQSPEDLITRKYVDENKDRFLDKTGDTMTGLLIAEEGITSEKNIQAIGVIRTGETNPGEPAIEFFDKNSVDHSRRIYFDAFNKNQLRVDVSSAKEGYKIWHDGNIGIGSGLDADLLQSFTPQALPISNATQSALDAKFKISGGLISGDVEILTILKTNELIAPLITGNVEFIDDVTFKNINSKQSTAEAFYGDGITLSLGGKINFINGNVPLVPTSFYWDTGADNFKVDTRTSSEIVWHSGNFIKEDYLRLDGGTMTGDLQIDTNLNVTGVASFDISSAATLTATSLLSNIIDVSDQSLLNKLTVSGDTELNGDIVADANFTQDVTVNGSLYVPNYFYGNHMEITSDLIVGGIVSATRSIQAGGFLNLTADGSNTSSIKFEDNITAAVTSAIKWNMNVGEFQVDLNGPLDPGNVDLTLWHAGNFVPDDKVNKAGDTMTGDLQVDTNLTVLGLTTQKETLIEDNLTVQTDATFEGDTSLNKIISDTEVTGNTTFTGEVQANILNVSGLAINPGHEITFMNGTNTGSLIKWDTGEFKVLADGNPQIPSEHHTLWHSGNFVKGDYLDKASYDSNGNGMVDNADRINNLTIETSVPVGALFTDTVYDDTNVRDNIQTNIEDIVELDNKNDANVISIEATKLDVIAHTAEIGTNSSDIITAQANIVTNATNINSKENDLGAPGVDNMILVSDVSKGRTWVDTINISGDITTQGNLFASNIAGTEISVEKVIATTVEIKESVTSMNSGTLIYVSDADPTADSIALKYKDGGVEDIFTLRTLNKYSNTDISLNNSILTKNDINKIANVPEIISGTESMQGNSDKINDIIEALINSGLMNDI